MSDITEQKIRAAEFMMATELALAGSLSHFRAALWLGDDQAIAIARHSATDSFANLLSAIEAQIDEARAGLRKGGGK